MPPSAPIPNPFHAGERAAQQRAGAGDVAAWAGGFIRDYMPDQHRQFFGALPFLVLASADVQGRVWVTLVEGEDGFIGSPDPRLLTVATQIDAQDPLAEVLRAGTDIGMVGIDLATRRRNRLSGHMSQDGAGYQIAVGQSFGNCPQYIHERGWRRAAQSAPGAARMGPALTTAQMDWIRSADTLFIGSGQTQAPKEADTQSAALGYDASHRGGAPGFVQVASATHLRLPDYSGNNFFNTIGNLTTDPRVGVVFVDFATGSLLHVSGKATVDWAPTDMPDPEAWRVIDIEIDQVIERPAALSLRWSKSREATRRLTIARREEAAPGITSFYLTPADGKGLRPFQAGQHLPIQVQIPGHIGPAQRSYSLSGAPQDTEAYRLTIKREDKGVVSRHIHDAMHEGDTLDASEPSGDFVLPSDQSPLVLISAGVGVTPMMSMLHALHREGGDRPVWVVHGARRRLDHALRDEMFALAKMLPKAEVTLFYSQPDADENVGADYDVAGRISARAVLDMQAGPEAHYMICGPRAFLADLQAGLLQEGIPEGHIHVESFGSAG